MAKKKESIFISEGFDFDAFEQEAIEQLGKGKSLTGKDGVLTPLIKRIVESALEGELEAHLNTEETKNRRNGRNTKSVKSSHGPFDLDTPRDRNSSFEPQLIKKRQTTLGTSVDNKILSLYGLGMSYSDISGHMEELYGLELSPATLSAVTDKILPVVERDTRPAPGRGLSLRMA